MKVNLLERLAVLLEADANNPEGIKFNLGTWGELADGHPIEFQPRLEVNCGTTGCALGLAALSGAFKDEGLKAKIGYFAIIPQFWDGDKFVADGFSSAVALFDISLRQAKQLFDPDFYRKTIGREAELEVVSRIRHLIATGTLDDIAW